MIALLQFRWKNYADKLDNHVTKFIANYSITAFFMVVYPKNILCVSCVILNELFNNHGCELGGLF